MDNPYQDLSTFSVQPVDTKILCLLKIGQKEHMENLSRGELFCHHLAHYKKPEFNDQPFYDEHEGLEHVNQPDLTYAVFKFKDKDGKEREIKADLAPGSPMITSRGLRSPAFCLHAINSGDWTHREFTEEEIPMFREYLQVPAEMEKFKNGGSEPYALVFRNPNEFINRIRTACKRDGVGLSGDMVRYVDLSQYHGKVPDERIGFIKQSRHKHEREYRFIFRSSKGLSNPFRLPIGDIQDITMLMPLKEFRSSFYVNFD